MPRPDDARWIAVMDSGQKNWPTRLRLRQRRLSPTKGKKIDPGKPVFCERVVQNDYVKTDLDRSSASVASRTASTMAFASFAPPVGDGSTRWT